MTGRSEVKYVKAFEYLYNQLRKIEPKEIFINCEIAAKNAFIKVFECSKIIHCLTHFSAAVHRSLINLNLEFEI
jgi:hypothetical protein